MKVKVRPNQGVVLAGLMAAVGYAQTCYSVGSSICRTSGQSVDRYVFRDQPNPLFPVTTTFSAVGDWYVPAVPLGHTGSATFTTAGSVSAYCSGEAKFTYNGLNETITYWEESTLFPPSEGGHIPAQGSVPSGQTCSS